MGMRMALETWFDTHGIRPRILGEFEDSALIEVAGSGGPRLSQKAIPLTMELGGVPSTNSGGWSVNRHRFFLRERRLYRFQRPFRR